MNAEPSYEPTECWDITSFGLQLARIRGERGISARRLSLDLGYNKNYIYSIESGRNFPTMEGFFEICHYLQIEPGYFFCCSQERFFFSYFLDILKKLTDEQLKHLYFLAEDLAKYQ